MKAVIPVRQGSQRVKNKNFKELVERNKEFANFFFNIYIKIFMIKINTY